MLTWLSLTTNPFVLLEFALQLIYALLLTCTVPLQSFCALALLPNLLMQSVCLSFD